MCETKNLQRLDPHVQLQVEREKPLKNIIHIPFIYKEYSYRTKWG